LDLRMNTTADLRPFGHRRSGDAVRNHWSSRRNVIEMSVLAAKSGKDVILV
jgi:hypothetical protein